MLVLLLHYSLNIPVFQNNLYWITWIASSGEIFFPDVTQVEEQKNLISTYFYF